MRAVHLTGLSDYARVHALQERLVEARRAGQIDDVLLTLQHPPTITLGRARGSAGHVVAPGDAPVVQIERGGDVTWHAPGQLVGYPIVALGEGEQDLRAYLGALEDAVVMVLEGQGVVGGRDERNTGVWVDCADGARRKICSLGVACRGWVTWHGLALNVDNDLADFARVQPCGFGADVMTRLADHVPDCPTPDELVPALRVALATRLRRSLGGCAEMSLDEAEVSLFDGNAA